MKSRLLLGSDYPAEELRLAGRYAEVYRLGDMDEAELDAILPSIDCLLVHFWPPRLDRTRLSRMKRLSFVQTGLAGVNHIPFGDLPPGVLVCSNAGGYSDEVGEFAWGLLLAAGKRLVKLDRGMRSGSFRSRDALELGREILVLKGRRLGILGYGGIGRKVAKLGRAFGMEVTVLSRREVKDRGVRPVRGQRGLEAVLRGCDALVLALPLTRSTRNLIGGRELSMMKPDAVVVNVARAEIVDEEALYSHLTANVRFFYATDVWWTRDGAESYHPSLPFFGLDNFVGTPHVSGPSAVPGRGPLRSAVKNVLRYLRGEEPLNAVDRREYV